MIVALALVIVAAACFTGISVLSRLLPGQYAYERWQGDGELRFSQISCVTPINSRFSNTEVNTFRSDAMQKIHEAALDITSDGRLMDDCWSTVSELNIEGETGSTKASVIAVGGDFFTFHPLRLLSGCYFGPEDIMHDRVVLDEELSWLLFGSSDVQGMSVTVQGKPFIVAGVIDREDDFASSRAYTAGMGFFMDYDAFVALNGSEGADCYEVVLPEPVDGFAESVAREKFPLSKGSLIVNSGRFSAGRLYQVISQFGTRSMQSMGTILPYWENAARCVEDICALLLFIATAALIFPAIMLVIVIIRLLIRGKEAVEDELYPRAKDSVEEFFRVRSRKRWEKKHGNRD